MAVVGVIGLGRMGLGMAETLLREGFEVVGFDLDPARREMAAALGATNADSIAALCAATDQVVLSLPEAQHVDAVVTGPGGIMESNRAGMLVMDATTSEPEMSRHLAGVMAEAGHGFLDAPVSGGPSGAKNGTLAIMVGGADDLFARARPVLDAMSAKLVHIGPPGAGNVVKLINNLMTASHTVIAAEAALLAMRAEVDPKILFEVVNAGSGRSLVSELVIPAEVLTGSLNFGFKAALMRKDVRLAMALAEATGTDTDMVSVAGRIWAESADNLAADADYTAVAAGIIERGLKDRG